jgi:hypothetical protein
MVALSALWMPILLAAVIVFVASSVMHMLLPYHKSDYKKIPGEDKVLAALRSMTLPRGLYVFPHCDHKNMKTPEMQEKYKQGPVGMLTVFPTGLPNMGKFLGLWFVYCLIVGFFTAYITGRTVAPGAHYLVVYRVAGAVSFMAYGLANISNGIWKGQPWSNVIKEIIDGLIYAGLTGGTFGWLWPR